MISNSLFDITSLSPLYEAVQSAKLFADSKFFVDCTPKLATNALLAAYAAAREQPDFNLKDFVTSHFNPPAEAGSHYQSANKPILQHLTGLWDILKRSPDDQGGTLIPLPHPYIVPGGRFREVYYWDSYFTMLGLQVSGYTDMIQNMVDNFAYLIRELGFIPNGNRTYYLGRSQPPFFALMVSVLAEEKGYGILLRYKEVLEKEYDFWMKGERAVRMPDGLILNRYWDDLAVPRPEAFVEDTEIAYRSDKSAATVYRHIRAAAESGWDFSSRWFKEADRMETIQTTDIIPVDLNCLLLFLETSLLQIYEQLNDREQTGTMQSHIQRRRQAIEKYCWDEQRGFYFDYHLTNQNYSAVYTLAAVYPLFFGIASKRQAERVSEILAEKFLQPGGLVTTLSRTGQQWDAPNGWAPLQWMAYKGLLNFDLQQLALQIKTRWMQTNEKVYAETGKMMEKYNVTDTSTRAGGGEYPNQDGFGWTNGVYLAFSKY
ncbi:MAG: alpha,alpha-trehalase TreF [Sediminibacterium sp.]